MTQGFNHELFVTLGRFTNQLRNYVATLPEEGGSALAIINHVESAIREAGYAPAFPCTISLNEVAAHATLFDEDYHFQRGDVVKIDFGVVYQGHITDNAVTVEVGTNAYEQLFAANREALDAVVDAIKPGVSLTYLGELADAAAKRHGFSTIQNLCGHEIGLYDLHCGLNIPNYANGDQRIIGDTMELAIEPFLSVGAPKVKAAGPSHVLHLVNPRPVRDPIAKKVLEHIKTHYPHLPFAKRWLLDTFEKRKVLYALRVLKSQHIVYEYDALATVDGSIVSQFEDTVVFIDGEKTIITRSE